MRKFGSYLGIIIFIFSCTSKKSAVQIADKKETNYTLYYLKVEEAKMLYIKKENKKCFELLDSLFNKYKPINTLFIDELEMYAELALEFDKKDKLNQIVGILIDDYGYDVADYKGKLWENLRKESKLSYKELKSSYLTFRKNLNIGLRDSIVDFFKKDQSLRKTVNAIKIDSLDRLHEPYVINFIKRHGYPSFRLVGGNGKNEPISPAYMSVMLKHISLKGALELEPILLNEVKRGKCPRDVYAGMLDVHIAVTKEKTPFTYFGTYRDFQPADTATTNNARESIGLPGLNFEY